MKRDAKSRKKSRLRLLHQYYAYTGFYKFVGRSVVKAIIPIAIIVGAILAIDFYVLDLNKALATITETYSPTGILSMFFVSESLLGLIPPEIFIAWAGKSAFPIFYLSLLALASYLGGIVSYFIGVGITKIPAVKNQMEVNLGKYIKNTRKWGGFLIIVGALLPIPYSLTSIAAGAIRFPFMSYLMFGLFRFVRFYLYALVIFEMV